VRLLAASYAYPPLRYPRAIQVARLIAHLGDDVTVVCAEEPGEGDRTLLAAYPDHGRRVIRVPWSPWSRASAAARNLTLEDRLLIPDRHRPWQRDAARAIRRHGLLDRADVLVTFGQPMSDHLLGLRLVSRKGPRWVAHFSDPWVDSAFRSGGRVTRSLNVRLEGKVMARADAVVFTSEETAELVTANYPRAVTAKSHVLPHAHDPTLQPPARQRPAGLLVRYIGNFYGHRGPEPLFRALRALADAEPHALADVRVELVGNRDEPLADDALAGLPPRLVELRDPVDYVDSLALMRDSDLLLVLDAPGDRSPFLPSKLVDYLGAGRPIVALTPEGPAAALVRRAGGWHADPSDTQAVAHALGAALTSVRRGGPDAFGADHVADEYAAPAVAARFRSLLESVVPA
jgi:glycosyltransferase involved in cell wall biosynthesis